MTRFNTALALSLLLAGCPENNTNCQDDPDCENPCTDCAPGKSTIMVNVTADGASVDCDIELTGPSNASGVSSDAIEVDPGTYDVSVGTSDWITADGLKSHIINGIPFAARIDSINVDEGEAATRKVTLNAQFKGKHDCGYDVYLLDENAPDMKGDLYSSYDDTNPKYHPSNELDKQDIDVVNTSDTATYINDAGETVEVPNASVITPRETDLFGAGFLFTVDQEIRLHDESGFSMYVLNSHIELGSWSYILINPAGEVAEMFCWTVN